MQRSAWQGKARLTGHDRGWRVLATSQGTPQASSVDSAFLSHAHTHPNAAPLADGARRWIWAQEVEAQQHPQGPLRTAPRSGCTCMSGRLCTVGWADIEPTGQPHTSLGPWGHEARAPGCTRSCSNTSCLAAADSRSG